MACSVSKLAHLYSSQNDLITTLEQSFKTKKKKYLLTEKRIFVNPQVRIKNSLIFPARLEIKNDTQEIDNIFTSMTGKKLQSFIQTFWFECWNENDLLIYTFCQTSVQRRLCSAFFKRLTRVSPTVLKRDSFRHNLKLHYFLRLTPVPLSKGNVLLDVLDVSILKRA